MGGSALCDAWSAFEEAGIFDPDTGQRFRRKFWSKAVRGAAELFRAFRGREPSVEPLRHSGIRAAKLAILLVGGVAAALECMYVEY